MLLAYFNANGNLTVIEPEPTIPLATIHEFKIKESHFVVAIYKKTTPHTSVDLTPSELMACASTDYHFKQALHQLSVLEPAGRSILVVE